MNWEHTIIETLFKAPLRNGIYKSSEFQGTGIKIVNMKELFGFDFIGSQDMRLIELNDDEKDKYLIEEGDLLFGRRSLVEEGAGKTSIVKNLTEQVCFESSIIRLRLDEGSVIPLFYYYYFKSYTGRSSVLSIVTGANVKGIKGSDLKRLSVPYPPLPTQRRIASILSAYDDLIENNLRRIKLLEEAAQHIYREWFVRMRFPGWEGVTFGEDGLPEGWRKEEIGIVADVNLYSIKTTNAPSQIKYIDISSTYTGYFDQPTEFEFSLAPSRARRILNHGDTIFSTVRPNRKIYALVLEPDENLIASTGFAVITPKRIKDYPFIYQSVCNDDFVRRATALATGAAYPAINQSEFQKILILKPSGKHIDEYFECCDPIFRQREILLRQNIKLKEARDILLPRLMNQTIEV